MKRSGKICALFGQTKRERSQLSHCETAFSAYTIICYTMRVKLVGHENPALQDTKFIKMIWIEISLQCKFSHFVQSLKKL